MFFFCMKMYGSFAKPKNMAVITRRLYYWGGRKAGFHCTIKTYLWSLSNFPSYLMDAKDTKGICLTRIPIERDKPDALLEGIECCFDNKFLYYSFKIFPRFWLAKITRLIHHNQLLLTKFGRNLTLTRKWRQKCSFSQVKAPLTKKTWGRGWVVLVGNLKKWRTFHSFQE